MRKSSFLTGFVLGALMFGGIGAAATGITAILSNHEFYFNGARADVEAYIINGNNYLRLRDVAEVLDISIDYNNGVVMVGENKRSDMIDGKAHSKEDYSSYTNPEIFDEVYTREAYNAIRQSIVDIKEITSNTDDNKYNSNYSYANYIGTNATMTDIGKTNTAMNSVGASLSGYYNFKFGFESGKQNYYEYPGYRICMPYINTHLTPAIKATDSFIVEINSLSDRQKLKMIADYICDRVAYKDDNAAGINRVFTETPPVNAICSTYSNAFIFLCQRAEIPCVSIVDDTHAWNEVYVDGKWYITDINYYDVARTDNMLLRTSYPRADINPDKTNFAKELLVPGSTIE